MKRFNTVGTIVLVFIILALAGCGGHNNSPNLRPSTLTQASNTGYQAPIPEEVFTDEDWELLNMPYDERVAYLQERFKELVYEFHGIVIDDSLTDTRITSASTSVGDAVCVADDSKPGGGNADWFNERLSITEDIEGESWSLSFLERLNGDYNFDGVVSIADLTPLAVTFGAKYDYGENEWPDDEDGKVQVYGEPTLVGQYPELVDDGFHYNAYWVSRRLR